MQKLPNEQKQKEIIREIEKAEQKSREMAKFSQELAEKWLNKRTQINS